MCKLHATTGPRPHLCHDCARAQAAAPAPLPVRTLRFDERDLGTVKITRHYNERGAESVRITINR